MAGFLFRRPVPGKLTISGRSASGAINASASPIGCAGSGASGALSVRKPTSRWPAVGA
jgi:hypothetical protein